MRTYRFHASPAAPYWSWNYHATPVLAADALMQTLAGAVVRELVASPHGGFLVDVQIDRPDHHVALADIESALRQLGYDTAQAVITESATSVVEGALLGTAGGGALGSATKDPWAMLLTAAIGLVVGVAVGSGVNTIRAMYQADRLHPFGGGGWQFTQLPLPQPDGGQQPGPSWRIPATGQ